MVRAGINLRGRTDLHIIQNGNMTAQRYANEIVRPCSHDDSFLSIPDEHSESEDGVYDPLDTDSEQFDRDYEEENIMNIRVRDEKE
ncbi:hypothetical protein TNCV_1026391 [Trichonephila clavipes]|nr:hypothetical protein TNCV_1026391 [Trichonephila clavipes]